MSGALALKLVNRAGGTETDTVVFITGDSAYNKLTLSIALPSGTTLTPGKIPDPANPPDPGTGSTLYLDLSALGLPAPAWKRLKSTGTHWATRKFGHSVLGLTPTSSLPIAPAQDPPAIRLGGIVTRGPAKTVQLGMLVYNVDDVDPSAQLQVRLLPRVPRVVDLIQVQPSHNELLTSIKGAPEAPNRFALEFTRAGGVSSSPTPMPRPRPGRSRRRPASRSSARTPTRSRWSTSRTS